MMNPEIEGMSDSDFYKPEDLAIKLNCSLKSVRTWTQAHRVPGQRKIGRVWRYYKPEIEKAILRENFLNVPR
jgi:hypothetical protein